MSKQHERCACGEIARGKVRDWDGTVIHLCVTHFRYWTVERRAIELAAAQVYLAESMHCNAFGEADN